MQDLQLPTSIDSNTERQEVNHSRISGGDTACHTSTANNTSEFMSSLVRSNSDQIELHQDNKNADLERQAQEVTSPSVPPGFKAAAAAVATATAAAMTSVKPYIASLNRGNRQSSTMTAARDFRPTATLHYTPPHQQDGQPRRSQLSALQQQPQHGLLPRQPPTRQPPPPNAVPMIMQQPPPPNAAPPTTHGAAQQKKQHKGGDKREVRMAYDTGAIPKTSRLQEVPMNACTDPKVGQSRDQRVGHNLPIAVMPVRQQFQAPAIKQRHANGGHLLQQQTVNTQNYATGHYPCTSTQAGLVAAMPPPASRALPPVPPLLRHLCSSPSNGALGGWGPTMQGRGRSEPLPMHRRMPYHLPRPPITGNAHMAYVEYIPSASVASSRMRPMGQEIAGHMPPQQPPPYQPMPPPMQPHQAQQLLVLTPHERSMEHIPSEAGASSRVRPMGQEILGRMPPPHPPPYQQMPPSPQPPKTPD